MTEQTIPLERKRAIQAANIGVLTRYEATDLLHPEEVNWDCLAILQGLLDE